MSENSRARPDIVFPRARIAVFVDGCFWHWCEEHAHLPKANAALWRSKLLANRQRDASSEAILVSEGWRVVRVWEHDDVGLAADRVERELQAWDLVVRRSGARGADQPSLRSAPIVGG